MLVTQTSSTNGWAGRMPIDANLWVQGLYGILLFFGAVAMYLNSRQRPSTTQRVDSVVAGVGVGFIERETSERLVDAAERIAVATETLADRRQASIDEKLDVLLDRLQQAEERGGRHRQRATDDVEATRGARRR